MKRNFVEYINYVIENYDDLEKAENDNGSFVIIAEIDESEYYSTHKECLGINREGKLIWCFLSGCSCRGKNENKTIKDLSFKEFQIEMNQTAEDFYNNNFIKPYNACYASY